MWMMAHKEHNIIWEYKKKEGSNLFHVSIGTGIEVMGLNSSKKDLVQAFWKAF